VVAKLSGQRRRVGHERQVMDGALTGAAPWAGLDLVRDGHAGIDNRPVFA
jgi:hypothetical protein